MRDPARQTSYDVVLAVDESAAFANLLLPRLLNDRNLPAQDAAFATELTYGTLRWQGVLDEVIAAAARRSVTALDPPVRAVLRLGAYQLLHMRVPSHAAVDSSVNLARDVAGHRVTGLVNAVLRAIAKQDFAAWVEQVGPSDDLGRLAFSSGYPRWIATAFLDALGGGFNELRVALQPHRPVTHLVARPGRVSRDDLAAVAGPSAEAGPWSPYAVRLTGGGDPANLAPVRDGRAAVQDEGSQLVALALARATAQGGERAWLDMCAGPGGKASLLAGLRPADVALVAADLRPHRARLVADALVGTGAITVVADGTRPAWPPGAFDRVLLDAPCTGLGALRRRPEVRWRRREQDVERLHALQVALLRSAAEAVRPGGLIAYVTCSPHLRETRDVVDTVLADTPRLRREDARPLIGPVPDLGDGPDVQLWPHRHGTDAMYLALLSCAD
jgi:16S rRNA (cytosine967-C5)-methyltransferase